MERQEYVLAVLVLSCRNWANDVVKPAASYLSSALVMKNITAAAIAVSKLKR